jgi:hypothetical protein
MPNKVHMTPPTEDGRHPKYDHLVMFEVDRHYDRLLLKSPAKEGDALISWEDWNHMVGDTDQADLEFAYCDDEYLDILKEPDEWRG